MTFPRLVWFCTSATVKALAAETKRVVAFCYKDPFSTAFPARKVTALKKLVESKQASGEKSSGVTVQTKDGPMDALASCAKRLGAMKVCEQLPFPGSPLCQSATESEFPCPTK